MRLRWKRLIDKGIWVNGLSEAATNYRAAESDVYPVRQLSYPFG
jgi:hypothetical protein